MSILNMVCILEKRRQALKCCKVDSINLPYLKMLMNIKIIMMDVNE